MSGIGGSKGESSSTTTVDIPDIIKPLISGGSRIAGDALTTLQGIIGGGKDLIAGFDPLQTEGQDAAVDIARGGGGYLPTAQQFFGDAARGLDLSQILPETAFNTLNSAAGGNPGDLSNLPPEALAALTSTAGGDFLYGGEGFNAAVDAATRAAMPQIRSQFGNTRGGLSGVLARDAVGQRATDAFASQYGSERNRQLSAAGLLADLTGENQNRALSASNLMGGFATGERDRAERAAGALPELGLLSSNILRGVGEDRQRLEQQRLTSPLENNLMLLQAALSGVPLEALLGQSTSGEQSNFGFSFGGSA